jgi:N-acetylmuramic acid 6-phosphate etherase
MRHRTWHDLPTEAINADTLGIDTMPVGDIIDLMGQEDRKVVSAVHKERDRIAHGVGIIVDALKRGGRVILIGAGTSGRLGVLEATEMPPTFGTPAKLVQAVMAGGQDAVFRAKEGVEDNFKEGGHSIARLRVSKRDVVIGVSASGMTPFVRGGLTYARNKGVRVIFITCWPGNEMQNYVDLLIAPEVGPEVIAGSTRLKAGTAAKMVLNMLTTIAMVRVGKTYGNLMVDVQTGSEKRRNRAVQIVAKVTALPPKEAEALLGRAKWHVKAAIVMHVTGSTWRQAIARLAAADDSVRAALGRDLSQVLGERAPRG